MKESKKGPALAITLAFLILGLSIMYLAFYLWFVGFFKLEVWDRHFVAGLVSFFIGSITAMWAPCFLIFLARKGGK